MKLVLNRKLLFLVPLLGLLFYLNSFSSNFDEQNLSCIKEGKEKFSNSTLKENHYSLFTVESEQDTSLCFDESEFEIDSFSSLEHIDVLNSFFITNYSTKSISDNLFLTSKNKVPLYMLFCKWKLHQ